MNDQSRRLLADLAGALNSSEEETLDCIFAWIGKAYRLTGRTKPITQAYLQKRGILRDLEFQKDLATLERFPPKAKK